MWRWFTIMSFRVLCTKLSMRSNNSNDVKLHPLQIHGAVHTPRLLVLVHKHPQHAPTIFLTVPHQTLRCPKLHLHSPQQIWSVLLVEDEDTWSVIALIEDHPGAQNFAAPGSRAVGSSVPEPSDRNLQPPLPPERCCTGPN
jgi:hypothetical protein